MLKPLTEWSKTVTLVPYSGVQFLDFGFNLDDTRRIGRSFIERPDASLALADGSIRLRFIPLAGDDEQDRPVLDQAVADEAAVRHQQDQGARAVPEQMGPGALSARAARSRRLWRGAARHRAHQLGARAGRTARCARGTAGS